MDETNCQQRGYLREDYRLFHLRDELGREVDSHYHEFHKLVFFRSGRVSYSVDGRLSDLQEGDIVLVPMGSMHRVSADPGVPYERVIVYLSPDFIRRCSTPECGLDRAFSVCRERGRHVLRPERETARALWVTMERLERALAEDSFGAKLLSDSLICQLLISLARQAMAQDDHLAPVHSGDSKAVDILHYINDHLTESISIDALAERFFLSKYHMMRSFRAETGFTIHAYITEKRLLAAREMIFAGKSAADACYDCGYRDYSAFSRAFKKQFGFSPRGGRRP